MKHAEVVSKIYGDFANGDAAAVLDVLAEDVEFRLAEGHPYRGSGGAWTGKQAIAEHFFAVAAPEWDAWSIHVDELVEAPGAVVVEGRYSGLYKPTGRRMDLQVCHVWRFRGAEVASFHQYVDTASLQRVMGRAGGSDAAPGLRASGRRSD
jgi:ketosteroid isomerase-like protein